MGIENNFFQTGGSSMMAGKLVAKLRKKFECFVSVGDCFNYTTVREMAELLESRAGGPQKKKKTAEEIAARDRNFEDTVEITMARQMSCCSKFVQAIPLILVYPLRRISMWVLFLFIFIQLLTYTDMSRFWGLCLAFFLAMIGTQIINPIAAVLCKWLIICCYKEGDFPLWGGYYLRWWFVHQCINIFGRGMFSINEFTNAMHLRMFGARIGWGSSVDVTAQVTEFDLLDIGHNVTVAPKVILKPFHMRTGRFCFRPIKIGDNSVLELSAIVAPGHELAPLTLIGALSSSYEQMEIDRSKPEVDKAPVWMRIIIAGPLLLVTNLVCWSPIIFLVWAMTSSDWYNNALDCKHGNNCTREVFDWFTHWQRILFYLMIRIARKIFVPWIFVIWSIMLKWAFIGTFTEGPAQPGCFQFKRWLMAQLLPGGDLAGVAPLVGTHYEIISFFFRMLGANVGKRIYWPGSGIILVEFDLLTVGDDVVFGSRSTIEPCDGYDSQHVTIAAGAMVADRCYLRPGVTLERGAVLGSGSIGKKGFTYPAGSIWVGSHEGNAVKLAQEEVEMEGPRPFGKAFYHKQAPYFVWPIWMHVLFNTSWMIVCVAFRAMVMLGALITIAHLDAKHTPPLAAVYGITLCVFVVYHFVASLMALGIDIGSKWAVIGRRVVGPQAWDESPYCQRWQIYLNLCQIVRQLGPKSQDYGLLSFIQGSIYLVWYFRLMGAKIGDAVCLYPTGPDGAMMTEPELVEIGDGSCIDKSSLICHINTRGEFQLNQLLVGAGAVMRDRSRLLSGALMEDHATLLEHCLILGGDTVEEDTFWQGWPAEQVEDPMETEKENDVEPVVVGARRRTASGYQVLDPEGGFPMMGVGIGTGMKRDRSYSDFSLISLSSPRRKNSFNRTAAGFSRHRVRRAQSVDSRGALNQRSRSLLSIPM
eukprot:TRINITY_DN4153_c0_g1_i12.p1 TRINITY_DN4153_c0_g1~~TRINITY_DN4153_c0_g1_i12.p1  ORF type:complete len:925 (+),score=220.80 TRINITY_DN4153_c0_g1_i12:187-2961(+)